MAKQNVCGWASLLVVFATGGVAAADPARPASAEPTSPAMLIAPPGAVGAAGDDDEVSPETAALLSLGGTIAAYATIGIGLSQDNGPAVAVGALGTLIMPSVGRWYAHSPGYGGLVIRGGGIAAAALGAVTAVESCPKVGGGCDSTGVGAGVALFVIGGLAYAGGTFYDIYRAPQDAREHNAHLHDVALVPVIQPDRRASNYGVALAGRF